MLNRKYLCVSALAGMIALGGLVSISSAGIFDGLKPRRAGSKPSQTSALRRAQSPSYDPAAYARSSYVSSTGYQPVNYTVDSPWYGSGDSSGGTCCGPEDKCGAYKRQCRRSCDQTYYCPVPPYCYACFGHYPTCWTRLNECQLCPRVEYSNHPPPRTPSRRAPASKSTEPSIVPPPASDTFSPPQAEPPTNTPALPETSRRPSRSRTTRAATVAEQRTRWTGFADTVLEDDEGGELPADTLEAQIAAEDAGLEPPEFEPADEVLSDDDTGEETAEATE
ncbi:MAG: hypothetical protein ACT4QC_03405 [Planctomycetaceae bacterium]